MRFAVLLFPSPRTCAFFFSRIGGNATGPSERHSSTPRATTKPSRIRILPNPGVLWQRRGDTGFRNAGATAMPEAMPRHRLLLSRFAHMCFFPRCIAATVQAPCPSPFLVPIGQAQVVCGDCERKAHCATKCPKCHISGPPCNGRRGPPWRRGMASLGSFFAWMS